MGLILPIILIILKNYLTQANFYIVPRRNKNHSNGLI